MNELEIFINILVIYSKFCLPIDKNVVLDYESEFEENASHSQLKREQPPLMTVIIDNVSEFDLIIVVWFISIFQVYSEDTALAEVQLKTGQELYFGYEVNA